MYILIFRKVIILSNSVKTCLKNMQKMPLDDMEQMMYHSN